MKHNLFRRTLSVLLSALLLLGLFPGGALAAADTTAPELNSVSLSASTVTAPADITITADATDDLSGIEMCRIALYSAELDKTLSLFLEEKDGVLQGVLTLDAYTPSGVFKIVDIFIQDKAGNYRNYCLKVNSAVPGQVLLPESVRELELTITAGETPDTTPPQLKGVTLSETSVTVPGSLTVTAYATDDLSGADFCQLEFYNQAEDTYYSVILEQNSGKLQGVLQLDEYAPAGEYKIVHVYLADAKGNGHEYRVDPESSSVTALPTGIAEIVLEVKSSGPKDTEAPRLTGAAFSTNSVTLPGQVTVTFSATDDVSGANYASMTLFCLETGKELNVSAEIADGKLQGTLKLNEYVPEGVYSVTHAYVCDAAGRGREYSINAVNESGSIAPMPDSMKTLSLTVAAPEEPEVTEPEVTEPEVTEHQHVEVTDPAVTATCTEDGLTEGKHCSVCGEVTVAQETVKATGHKEVIDKAVAATCTEDGLTAGKHCSVCGTATKAQEVVKAAGHKEVTDAAVAVTCTADGKTEGKHCSVCGTVTKAQETVKATGHSFAEGKCSVCGAADPDYIPPVVNTVTRVAGGDRYQTSFKSADTLKAALGIEKFQNIVVASGTDFPDALAGSYLAAVKNAPILLVRAKNVTQVKDYIKANLVSGGTVYLLGGKNAVPAAMETGLEGFTVKRLGGATRYDTNLLILKEAGVGDKDILVCTGLNFADSLSASASGLPILLVKGGLTAAQKDFLASTTGKKIIVGGTGAVNTTVEKQLAAYGEVKRLAGNTRYDTSVLVAKEFFDAPTSAVLAYAQNFPDGLCGGPLAYALNAPLILTDNNKPTAAVKYATGLGIKSGYVLGGTGLISDKVVKNIFSMAGDDSILIK